MSLAFPVLKRSKFVTQLSVAVGGQYGFRVGALIQHAAPPPIVNWHQATRFLI